MKKRTSILLTFILAVIMLTASCVPALAAADNYCISKVTSAKGETLATMKLDGKTLTVYQNSEAKNPYYSNRLQGYMTPTSDKSLYNLRILAGLGNYLGSYTGWMLWEPVYSGKIDKIVWNQSDGVSTYEITFMRDSCNRITSLKYSEQGKYVTTPITSEEDYDYSNGSLSKIQETAANGTSRVISLTYSEEKIAQITSTDYDENDSHISDTVIAVSYNSQGLVSKAAMNTNQSTYPSEAYQYDAVYSYNSNGFLTRWQGYLRDMKIHYDANGCIARTDDAITPSNGGGDTWTETYVFSYIKI